MCWLPLLLLAALNPNPPPQDMAYAAKVEARNSFESYVYSLKNKMDESGIKEAMGEDAATLTEKIDAALAWLDENQSADKEEFDSQRKELEDVAMPIMQKAMQATGGGGGGGMPGGPEGGEGVGDGDGPTVEEVD